LGELQFSADVLKSAVEKFDDRTFGEAPGVGHLLLRNPVEAPHPDYGLRLLGQPLHGAAQCVPFLARGEDGIGRD
jgi:hypothetical protein